MSANDSNDHAGPWWRRAVGLVPFVAYLLVFFRGSSHGDWWVRLVIPDVIVGSWFGGTPPQFAVTDRWPIIDLTMLWAAISLFGGWAILDALRLGQRLTSLERYLFALAIGMALVSTWTLLAGWLIGLSSRWVVAGPPGALALIGWLRWALSWRTQRVETTSSKQVGGRAGPPTAEAGKGGSHRTQAEPQGTTARIANVGEPTRGLGWVVWPFATFIFLGSLLPPWEFDVLEYHLQTPKEWFERGRIDFLPHNVYGNMPLGAEMPALFAMTMARSGERWWWGALAGKAAIGLAAPLTALALFSLGRRFFTPAIGVLAAVLFLATPWIAHVSMAGLIDGVVGWFLAMSAYALALWWREPRGRALPFVSGLLAGAAWACKYPAIIWIGPPLVVGILGCRQISLRHRGLAVALLCTGVTVVSGPWFLKNWSTSGNPVYPLAYSVFDGRTRTPEKDEQWRRAHRDRDSAGRTFTLSRFVHHGRQVCVDSPWLSPLLWPGVVAAFVYSTYRRECRCLAGFLAFGFAMWWLLTHRIDRFWLPLLPPLALLAAIGVRAWAERVGRRWFLAASLPMLILQALVIAGPPSAGQPMLGLTQWFVPLDSLRQALVPPAYALLNELPADETHVLLVGEARPFYLTVPATYSTCFDDCVLAELVRNKSRDERRAALVAAGITHVYVAWGEIDRYRSPGNYGFSEVITRELIHGELVREQGLLRPLPLEDRSNELFEVVAGPEIP